MRILLVGNGGREHALAWKIARDRPDHELLITRGNGGTTGLAQPFAVEPGDVDGIVDLVEREEVGFTVVGPEVPLAAGLADRLRESGHGVFGPGTEAARLEDRGHRERAIARARARGETVTHEQLLEAAQGLRAWEVSASTPMRLAVDCTAGSTPRWPRRCSRPVRRTGPRGWTRSCWPPGGRRGHPQAPGPSGRPRGGPRRPAHRRGRHRAHHRARPPPGR
ncbi:MAG: hypothetical protein KY397_07030, partial [Gemmatimonadetes bacterium]|nr:hypothetical protein [Gemmatimonadota bacterium]